MLGFIGVIMIIFFKTFLTDFARIKVGSKKKMLVGIYMILSRFIVVLTETSSVYWKYKTKVANSLIYRVCIGNLLTKFIV